MTRRTEPSSFVSEQRPGVAGLRSGAGQSQTTNRRRMLARTLAGAAAAAVLAQGRALTPGVAQASTVDEIVGAWTVDISSNSSPYKGVQTINADGTLALTFLPSGPSASGAPPRLYATGCGVWMRLGAREYLFSLTAPSVTPEGIYQGQVVVSGHAQLDDNMQTFESTYSSRSTSAEGGLVGTNGGTINGTRIVVSYP